MTKTGAILVAMLLGGCGLYSGDDEAAPDAGDVAVDAEAAPPAWGTQWTVTGTRTGTCEAGPLELAATVTINSVNPDSIMLRIGDDAPVACLATFTDLLWRLNCSGTTLSIDPENHAGAMMIPYTECPLAPATFEISAVVE